MCTVSSSGGPRRTVTQASWHEVGLCSLLRSLASAVGLEVL